MWLSAEQMSSPTESTPDPAHTEPNTFLYTTRRMTTTKGPASLLSHSRRGLVFFSFFADNGWKYSGLDVWCGFLFVFCWFSCGKCLIRAISCAKQEQGHRQKDKEKWRNPHLSIVGSNILTFALQNMTFNPDWHPENGWTCKHAPFIIQSAPELSTWINKSGSYLLKQNWISSPTGSGWRKLSAPLFWFVSASYRDRILFFSAIQPPALWSPGTPFPMCCVRPIGPETTSTCTTSLLSCRWCVQSRHLSAVNKSKFEGRWRKTFKASCEIYLQEITDFNTWVFLRHLFNWISQFYPHSECHKAEM